MKKTHQTMLTLFLFLSVQKAIAMDENEKDRMTLTLRPKECVVLKEGDKCYANVKLTWKASAPGAFCLYRRPGAIKLACWQDASEGKFLESLVTRQSVTYYLELVAHADIVAKKKLLVSWVYKKSTRLEHTWRIF